MAKTNAPPMHDEFASWYRAVSLDDDQARRQARWEGVSSIVRHADKNTVEALLRLAHQSRHVPAANVAKIIRSAFKVADTAFEMSDNDREIQILAGASLSVLMETDDDVGALAALTATTARFGGARHPDLPMDLAVLGETAIVRLGDANLKRPSFNPGLNVPGKFDFEGPATAIANEQTFDSVADAFKKLADTAFDVIEQLAQTRANVVQIVERFLRVQDEELQILWWLTGRRSSDLRCSFDAIPADARPLVLASELAEHTEFLPGPPSVKGILSRAGLNESQNIRIADAVNAPDSAWLQRLVGDEDPSFVSTPLHAAVKRQLETGSGEAWVVGWAASTGVDADYALSSLDLGNLFYRERLLLKYG